MNFPLRRRRALAAARRLGGDALLVTHLPDLRYLSGFTGSAGALLLTGGRPRLFTDGRYREQAAREAAGVTISVENRSALVCAVEWMAAHATKGCVFDAAATTVAQLELMRRTLPRNLRRGFFQASEHLVARQREIKDAEELDLLCKAADLGSSLFEELLGEIRSGVTESEIALLLERSARQRGAQTMSFDSIVASGERSSLPHGRATAARLPRRGFVTLDFGVVYKGYCSDMTRTVHLGRPSVEARTVYDSVLEAQLAAVHAIAPGVEAGAVDEAARSVLRRAGLDRHYLHSTGHGVGLEIHEGPRLAAKQTSPLRAGMVVTIEPGVYLPGRFGVRIEDMVRVTEVGYEVLTSPTKTLIEL